MGRRMRRWYAALLQIGLCGVLFLAGCVAPQARPEPAQVGNALAEAFVTPAPTPVPPERWILVRKAAHTLSLFEGDQLLRTYPVVLGKQPSGPKLYQGDHRTPEGEYHIVLKYFHPYWERFMGLDYPTPMNREVYSWSRDTGLLPVRGRGVPGIGGAIRIHGTEDESLNRRGVNWTEGCISLFNRDINELYDLLPIGTRVVIEP